MNLHIRLFCYEKIGSGVKTCEPPVTRIVSCFALSQSCFNSDSRGAFAPVTKIAARRRVRR